MKLYGCFLGLILLFAIPSRAQTCHVSLPSSGDISTALNNAINSAPTTGCVIHIPAIPASSSACYELDASILISGKPIILAGEGPGTCINYTPASGTAITFQGIGSPLTVAGQSFGVGLRDITLQQNTSPSCSTNTSIGIFLDGVAGFTARNVNVMQFGTGITFGSNTFMVNWDGGSFRANCTNLNYPEGLGNSGENLSFSNMSFSNGGQQASGHGSTGTNCVQILSGSYSGLYGQSVEMNFTNDSFDACQVVIANDNPMQIRFINPHFEDDQSVLSYPFVQQVSKMIWGTNTAFINPMFFIDAQTVTADSFIELNGNSRTSISNPVMFGWNGISTVPGFVRIQGNGTAMVTLTGIAIGNVGQQPYAAPPLYTSDGVNTPVIND